MSDTPIHVTDQQFKEKVLDAKLPVLVDFWAPWCSPCRMIAPTLEKLSTEYSGKLIVAKINTDENQVVANTYQIQGIPTLLFLFSGKVVHRQVGVVPESSLREIVDQFLEIVNSENE